MKKQRVNRIYKLMTYETDNLKDQIHYVLQESTKYLGAELGIISRIEENSYTYSNFAFSHAFHFNEFGTLSGLCKIFNWG